MNYVYVIFLFALFYLAHISAIARNSCPHLVVGQTTEGTPCNFFRLRNIFRANFSSSQTQSNPPNTIFQKGQAQPTFPKNVGIKTKKNTISSSNLYCVMIHSIWILVTPLFKIIRRLITVNGTTYGCSYSPYFFASTYYT